LRPAGIVKSAKQAQISGQTVAYPANAGLSQAPLCFWSREDQGGALFLGETTMTNLTIRWGATKHLGNDAKLDNTQLESLTKAIGSTADLLSLRSGEHVGSGYGGQYHVSGHFPLKQLSAWCPPPS
jgi:hypothetical protein